LAAFYNRKALRVNVFDLRSYFSKAFRRIPVRIAYWPYHPYFTPHDFSDCFYGSTAGELVKVLS